MQKSNTGFQFIIEKGFCNDDFGVSMPIVEEVVEMEVVEEEVIVEKKIEVFTESIDVPDFVKAAIAKRKAEQNKVIYVNFSKEEEKEEKEVTAEDIAEAFEDVVNHVKEKIKRNPVFKYFFGEDK